MLAVCFSFCTKESTPEKKSQVKLYLSETYVELAPGGKVALKVEQAPSDESIGSLIWSSSNSGIAKVDANGNVEAVAEGEATIKAYPEDDESNFVCCTVVVRKTDKSISALSFKQSLYTIDFDKGETIDLSKEVVFTPDDAASKTLKWESNDPTVASVSQSGLVTPVSAGSTKIFITALDGSYKTACCDLKVKGFVEQEIVIEGCLSKDGFITGGGQTIVFDTENFMTGSGSISVETVDAETTSALFYKKISCDASAIENRDEAIVRINLYISDIEKLPANGNGQFELTSSGGPDKKESSWSWVKINELNTVQNGWNTLVLPLSKADHSSDGGLDLSDINYFRFYHLGKKAGATVKLDRIWISNK